MYKFLDWTKKIRLYFKISRLDKKPKHFLEWKTRYKIASSTVYSIVIKFLNYLQPKEQKGRNNA